MKRYFLTIIILAIVMSSCSPDNMPATTNPPEVGLIPSPQSPALPVPAITPSAAPIAEPPPEETLTPVKSPSSHEFGSRLEVTDGYVTVGTTGEQWQILNDEHADPDAMARELWYRANSMYDIMSHLANFKGSIRLESGVAYGEFYAYERAVTNTFTDKGRDKYEKTTQNGAWFSPFICIDSNGKYYRLAEWGTNYSYSEALKEMECIGKADGVYTYKVGYPDYGFVVEWGEAGNLESYPTIYTELDITFQNGRWLVADYNYPLTRGAIVTEDGDAWHYLGIPNADTSDPNTAMDEIAKILWYRANCLYDVISPAVAYSGGTATPDTDASYFKLYNYIGAVESTFSADGLREYESTIALINLDADGNSYRRTEFISHPLFSDLSVGATLEYEENGRLHYRMEYSDIYEMYKFDPPLSQPQVSTLSVEMVIVFENGRWLVEHYPYPMQKVAE